MSLQQYKLVKTMRGAVAVEFALLLIPLLMLALGAAEFGRALYQYNTLVKATRDAVRHLSQFNPTESNYVQKEEEAKCLAVYGIKSNETKCIESGQPLAPGLTTSMVTTRQINTTTSEGTPITLVEVKISKYRFNFLLDPRALLKNDEQSTTPGFIEFGDIHATMRQS